ncbi:hypothetical protein SAMN05421538_105212 [Paracoccus isoporae]|uniref:Uncharacterized protein n=1 Tax=Paracoccus isoporae TaxID=591205 RepID=A0A1G7BUW9_9RHOB|nr:hypothetical protein [Paracoccus isoporae]SDE30803.1 hypothetical protein SAMN05421538_105212 [Paracoccus isoporae]
MTEKLAPSDQSDRPEGVSTGILPDLLAGIALGCLVGILVGLSASPVIASVIAAFLALIGTFFGFGGSIGPLAPKLGAARIAGFGFAMAIAFAGGIALRSHGALGPSFADRVEGFAVEGMEPSRAHDLAIFDLTGLRTGHLAQTAAPATPPASAPYAFGSEDGGADPNCAGLDARTMPAPDTRLDAMALSPEPWASFGRIGKALPVADRAVFAEAAFQERCGKKAAQ